jgi:flavorubredoxin
VFVNFLATHPPYRSDYRQRAEVAPPGTSIDFGPGRQIKIFDAPLRMLAAAWLHDPQTGVLFTSDSFGHVHLAREDDPIVVDEAHDRTTLDDVRAHLLTKFDWLAQAETQETLAALQAVFEAVEVTGIAPGHGCVLMGDRVVARHRQLMADVLCAIQAR